MNHHRMLVILFQVVFPFVSSLQVKLAVSGLQATVKHMIPAASDAEFRTGIFPHLAATVQYFKLD